MVNFIFCNLPQYKMLVSDKAMYGGDFKQSQFWLLNAVKTSAEKILICSSLVLAALFLLRGSHMFSRN